MIIKVQISLATTKDGTQQALIYNREKRYFWKGTASPSLLERMRGRPKVFFDALARRTENPHPDVEHPLFVLGNEAKDPGW